MIQKSISFPVYWQQQSLTCLYDGIRRTRSTKYFTPQREKPTPHVACDLLRLQSCLTLWDPMDCTPPGSSLHGILQARILEWVAVPFSRGSSIPGIKFTSLISPALAGRFFTTSATWEASCVVQFGDKELLLRSLLERSWSQPFSSSTCPKKGQ